MDKSEYFGFVATMHKFVEKTLQDAVAHDPKSEEGQAFRVHMDKHIHTLGRSPAQAAVHWAYAMLSEADSGRLRVVNGHFGIVPHSWFRITGNITEVDTEGKEFKKGTEFLVDINQDYIIDPACPSVSPSCLLIHQSSPMWMMYRESTVDASNPAQ